MSTPDPKASFLFTKVSKLIKVHRVIELDASVDTIASAVKTLYDHSINSAPVYSKAEGKYIGYFTSLDTVLFLNGSLLPSYFGAGGSNMDDSADSGLLPAFFEDSATASVDFHLDDPPYIDEPQLHSSPSLVHVVRQHPFSSLPHSSLLLDVILMIRRGHSVVPLINPITSRIDRVVSQCDVMVLLQANVRMLDHASTVAKLLASFHSVQLSIETHAKLQKDPSGYLREKQFGVRRENMAVVRGGDTVMHAIHIMATDKISTIPILDDFDNVMTFISVNDIRVASAGCLDNRSIDESATFSQLITLCVLPFVLRLRSNSLVLDKLCHSHHSSEECSISEGTSVRSMIGRFASSKLHSLYVVTDRKLVGVVGIQDVLNYIF